MCSLWCGGGISVPFDMQMPSLCRRLPTVPQLDGVFMGPKQYDREGNYRIGRGTFAGRRRMAWRLIPAAIIWTIWKERNNKKIRESRGL